MHIAHAKFYRFWQVSTVDWKHKAATLKLVQVVQEREGVLQLPAGQGEPRDGARAARGHGGGRPVQHELRHPLPAGAGQHRQVATRDITWHYVT